jgi:hypothetical protein
MGKEEKIDRFGSLAGGPPFGRQLLQLNRTAERQAASASDQAPLTVNARSFSMLDAFILAFAVVKAKSIPLVKSRECHFPLCV